MILSNAEIQRALEQGIIAIEPLPAILHYSSTSVDLHIGSVFHRWDEDKISRIPHLGMESSVDPSRLQSFNALSREFMVPAEVDSEGCHTINPWGFVLGITHERVTLPLESGIAARVEGRSSLARMGLMVHMTAPTIQSGWNGHITLEMANFGPWPIKLRPRELRVCQLIFERVGESPTAAPSTQFQGQTSPGGG